MLYVLLLCFTGSAISGDRASLALGDYGTGKGGGGSLARLSTDLELLDLYGVRTGLLFIGTGDLGGASSLVGETSRSSLMTGLSLESESNKFTIAASGSGFVVGHEVSMETSFLKKTFIGMGVINEESNQVPMSAYADIGTYISLLGFKIETKYRLTKEFGLSNGDILIGKFSYQPWITITVPF